MSLRFSFLALISTWIERVFLNSKIWTPYISSTSKSEKCSNINFLNWSSSSCNSDPRITFILVGSVFFIYILIILIFGMKKEIEPIQKNIKFKMPSGNIFIYGFLLMMN